MAPTERTDTEWRVRALRFWVGESGGRLPMKLEGIHHVTSITADAQANVDFYAGRLGLRLVKKTVNQDDPTVYHLFFGDDKGSPGLDLTFFEYPGARPGRAGTVHHVAWASLDNEQLDWRDRVIEAGANPTPVIDRYWFKSVYFREPSGVLFEIATMGPGFAVDEDPQHLGERLILPPRFEHLRDQLEVTL